jgi:hypothetical protein
MESGQQRTGTRDTTYNVVSVLYHALEAADTCARYREDAEQQGEQEMVELFDVVIERNREIANRAKEILAEQLGASPGEQIGEGGRQTMRPEDIATH